MMSRGPVSFDPEDDREVPNSGIGRWTGKPWRILCVSVLRHVGEFRCFFELG